MGIDYKMLESPKKLIIKYVEKSLPEPSKWTCEKHKGNYNATKGKDGFLTKICQIWCLDFLHVKATLVQLEIVQFTHG